MEGCGGKHSKSDYIPVLGEPPSYENIISHYYLQPGDSIEVKFFRNPELNESVIVRPDGRIALQLIDEVDVAVITPPQLEILLNEKYTPGILSF